MSKHAAPFAVRWRGGWAYVFSVYAGQRYREALGISERPVAGRPSGARAAQQAAQEWYANLVSGRIATASGRLNTTNTLQEAVAQWLTATATPNNHTSIATRRTQMRTVMDWASDEDRWKSDKRTPFQRVVADEGGTDYCMNRLCEVLRASVQREKTTLNQFFRWIHLRKWITSMPPEIKLPPGELGIRVSNQRSAPIDITPEEARKIIDALPEWSDNSGMHEPGPAGYVFSDWPNGRPDDEDAKRRVARFLNEKRKAAGVTIVAIDEAFGFNGMANTWTSDGLRARADRDGGSTIPSWDQWLKLRAMLAFGPELDEEVYRLNCRRLWWRFRVRDFAEILNETGLRPGTIQCLSVPEHYTLGATHLIITDDIEKKRFGRTVPLSQRAQEVLERNVRGPGLIFGKHELVKYLKAAALKVLPVDKAIGFARYDFRHGFCNNTLAVTGNNVLGLMYLVGHKRMTTTNKYIRPNQTQAEAAIAALELSNNDTIKTQRKNRKEEV